MFKICTTILITLVLLTGCSTRQVIEDLNGSTAQRLITHSLDNLMQQIPEEDFSNCADKNVFIKPHFIIKNEIYPYATERFKLELGHRFSCNLVDNRADADFIVDLFFTSLATEADTLGFSISFLPIPGMDQTDSISLLALEKFHGISEMYYYVSDQNGKVLLKREKQQNTIKTDKLGLPFISIPINTMD